MCENEQQLRTYFERYVSLNETAYRDLLDALQWKSYGKKEYLLKEGDFCRYQYFVLKGLLRSYSIDRKGKEKVSQISPALWWVTHMTSFIEETPSTVSIQALERVEVYRITKPALEKLYDKHPAIERAFRMIAEKMLIAIQRKNDYYIHMSGKDRYLSLIHQFPSIAQRVPQYMLASYLDLTPEYLSELRRSIS